MRRVLIDECLPVQLHAWLDGFDARTVTFMGWKGARNGDLLALAQGRFDVLLTADGFIDRQHSLAAYGIGLVVLPFNRREPVRRILPAIRAALTTVKPGETVRLGP
jgi:hypothetical protein